MTVSIDTDITGWTVTSQVRKPDGNLVDNLVFALVDAEEELSTFTFTKLDTSGWAEGNYYCDIRYAEGAGVVSITETFEIKVVRSNTK